MTRSIGLKSYCRGLIGTFSLIGLSLAAVAALPATAGAYATLAPQATFSSSPGLPDGRVFEQVSPANKDGNEAGGSNIAAAPPYIAGAPDGNGVLFFTNGPFGDAQAGVTFWSVAHRSARGWSTTAAIPRGLQLNGGNPSFFGAAPHEIFVSRDFSQIAYRDQESPIPDRASRGGLFAHPLFTNSVSWLTEPQIANAVPPAENITVAGGAPDFSTVYFAFDGTLVAEDNAPNPTLGGRSRADVVSELELSGFVRRKDMGFYEWHQGELRSAGVLPDGTLDPDGAMPAAQLRSVYHPNTLDNEVSENGTRAFFVSPDPYRVGGTCLEEPSTCTRSPELYVHETAPDGTAHSVLVSRDNLLPNVNGLPAPAPAGPRPITAFSLAGSEGGEGFPISYMYASPDGSRVFFQSSDRLTGDAPANAAAKAYEFDTETNSLVYLPGVSPEGSGVAQILASSRDGSRFIFEKRTLPVGAIQPAEEIPGDAVELDLFDEGRVTPIMPLTGVPAAPANAAADGSVFVFVAPHLAGVNDGGGGQILRYDVASASLGCVSCPPQGTQPTGPGVLGSEQNANTELGALSSAGTPDLAISEDGRRVVFQTTSPLAPQDTNGVADVYEWENGTVFLVSSGSSSAPSYFGGISDSGDDAFFSTNEGLAAGDTDGGYDVYDARIPRPGDNPPVAAVPCSGDVCQGPPNVPNLLSAPASATFNGLGNPGAAPTVAKPKAKAKRKARTKKRRVERRGKQGRRADARRPNGPTSKPRKSSAKRKGNG